MEKRHDQPTRTEPKMQLVEQINLCLGSGDYSRALDLLRGAGDEIPNDPELSELEGLARDGVKRIAEANRLVTESQELFAQRKSAEAIQLLRDAYELDKKNSLACTILANALVEHAHSFIDTDWLAAETLTNQALSLNPAHPTAKTVLNLIVDRKKTSSVEDWVSQANKLQSSGDLFAALAWVAEGLAVHPDDPKLLQIHDSIQRDQGARRRQARRGDLKDLRRLESEIDDAADVAVKQALAARIQAIAANYWTDGEILSVANRLLHQLGLASHESPAAPQSNGAPLIFHVPRPSAPEPPHANTVQAPPTQAPPSQAPISEAPSNTIPTESVPPVVASPGKVSPSILPQGKIPTTPLEPQLRSPQGATVAAAELSAPAGKVESSASSPKQPTRFNSTTLILVAAAIILCATIFFFTRKHPASRVANGPVAAPAVAGPTVSASAAVAPAASAPAKAAPRPALPALPTLPNTTVEKVTRDDQPPAETGRSFGSLLVIAGQDDARVSLNGKPVDQLTQTGQLRLANLELGDYVVQVSKSGFQDAPQQEIRIRKGEEAKLIFNLQPLNLQPQPRLASLTIQGGAPGTMVFLDQALIGTVQRDGTLSVSSVNPGDHTVELRKEQFLPRQFKEHFVAGGAISLAAADVALEAAPGELKITFAPPDAKVAIVNGELLKMVSSGVPLTLAAGTYTLTTRTADRFNRWSTLEIVGGQSKTLDLSLAPSGMSKWDDPGAWKPERGSLICKGGDFVLYGVASASGSYVFSVMLTKGHLLQWVLNYTDPRNYVLIQMDDKTFYRAVIRNGEKTDEIRVPAQGDTNFRTLQIHVSPTELVHQINRGNSVIVLDRWTQPGADLSLGKFGFYLPGNDQVALSSFAYYPDLNIR